MSSPTLRPGAPREQLLAMYEEELSEGKRGGRILTSTRSLLQRGLVAVDPLDSLVVRLTPLGREVAAEMWAQGLRAKDEDTP